MVGGEVEDEDGRGCNSYVSSPDFWGRGPGFESGLSHNDPDALQDHCVI